MVRSTAYVHDLLDAKTNSIAQGSAGWVQRLLWESWYGAERADEFPQTLLSLAGVAASRTA
jgi:hypothetical protein